MSRNIDSTMSAHLADGVIYPAFFASFQFRSGVSNAWTGVGPFTWNGLTFQGVGNFGEISDITEGSDVQADGMTVQLADVPFADAAGTTTTSPVQFVTAGHNGVQGAVSVSVTLDVTAGDMILVLADQNTYATSVANADPAVSDSQGNSYSLDQTGTGYYIGGHGHNTVLAHAFASGSGSLTVTSTGDASGNANQYLSVVIVQAAGIDGSALAVDFSDVSTISATGSSDGDSALLITQGDGAGTVWTPGTQLYSSPRTPVNPSDATSVWQIDGTTASQTGSGNFEHSVALVLLNNQIGQGPTVGSVATDIQLGAPAKIWFGLLDGSGALIGTPYLIFSGMVDQPTIDVDTETFTTALALENRLTNLQRPSGRRYTAADQRLFYPDDSGFNFVELLSDIALRWGS